MPNQHKVGIFLIKKNNMASAQNFPVVGHLICYDLPITFEFWLLKLSNDVITLHLSWSSSWLN